MRFFRAAFFLAFLFPLCASPAAGTKVVLPGGEVRVAVGVTTSLEFPVGVRKVVGVPGEVSVKLDGRRVYVAPFSRFEPAPFHVVLEGGGAVDLRLRCVGRGEADAAVVVAAFRAAGRARSPERGVVPGRVRVGVSAGPEEVLAAIAGGRGVAGGRWEACSGEVYRDAVMRVVCKGVYRTGAWVGLVLGVFSRVDFALELSARDFVFPGAAMVALERETVPPRGRTALYVVVARRRR